jgi:poly-gamma-glutamate capsule biosynthesis protein CapA/YwtB (metallophosphatase superfamily)
MRIAFTGDFYVPHSMNTLPSFGTGLRKLMADCTAVMVNFEGPLDEGSRSKAAFKTGPNLRQNAKTLDHLVQAGVTAVGLANNHSADFGENALRWTADVADAAGIQIAGLWQGDKCRFAEWREDGLVVRVLAFAEEEWSGDQKAGTHVAIFDLAGAANQIAAAKNQADAVLVCLHGNNEHSSLPNPSFARNTRFLIDCGADGVIVHHSHRISGLEIYRDRPIFFGLGNFLFATPAKNAHWHEGLLATVTVVRKSGGLSVIPQIYPLEVDPKTFTVEFCGPEKAAKIENDVAALSQIIIAPDSLAAQSEDFVAQSEKMYDEFLNPFAQSNRLSRILGRLWVRHVFLKKKRQAILINALRCDAHRSAMTQHLLNRLAKGG